MGFQPWKTIVPIFSVGGKNGNDIQQFLGTGSFIGDRPYLLTANHVIEGWNGNLAIVVLYDLRTLYPAKVIYQDKDKDLALLVTPGYRPESVLKLASVIPPNITVTNFEYGTTRTVGKEIQINPATRLGNVTRTLDLVSQYKEAGKGALELSFPALRGSSGSPVFHYQNEQKIELLGVIIANVNYHLLPAQIESVLDADNNQYQETHYLLPQGIAVNVQRVKELLAIIE